MSIFGSIMNKIFHHGGAAAAPAAAAPAASASGPAVTDANSGMLAAATEAMSVAQEAAAAANAAPTPAAHSEPVEVAAVLTEMAAKKGQPSDWQHSIVDLLKLLDLDSSLSARKELGSELSVHAGADGSAEQNLALHKAVMQKLAENGGKVPDSLRD